MKALKITLLFIMLTLILYADTITEITSISNPQQVFDCDTYSGQIFNYENRLIVQNHYKIEDYLIGSNGELQRIGLYETKEPNFANYIDGDRYYYLLKRPHEPTLDGIYVFNLSQTPMEALTYIDLEYLEIDPFSGISFISCIFFTQSYIFIPDIPRQRAWIINKDTYEVDGYIEGNFHGNIVIRDNLMVQQLYAGEYSQLILSSIDNNNQIQQISTISLDTYGAGVNDLILCGDMAVLSTNANVMLIDISNTVAPSIICTIPGSPGISGAIYDDGYLYVYSRLGDVLVFQIDDNGEYILITILTMDYRGETSSNICKVGDYLYINTFTSLKVFDVANGYQEVAEYGNFLRWVPDYSLSENDIYFIKQKPIGNSLEIYSVLDNSLICTLSYPYLLFPNNAFLQIIGDRLYLASNLDGSLYFDIYHLNGGNADLLNSVLVGYLSGCIFTIIDNKVFIEYVLPYRVEVYNLINDDLEPVGSFEGSLQNVFVAKPQNYIYNIVDSNLYIRDINNISSILFQRQLDTITSRTFLMHIDEHHFIVSGYGTTSYIYYFDIEQDILQQLGSYTHYASSTHNGVISINSFINDINTYYSIQDNNLVEIGELTTGRKVWHTYFFPERNKMVQVAYSGIWVYDIEYTSVPDGTEDIVMPAVKTELYSNFPNPFNPATTIAFEMAKDDHVVIDIFNIKGQKVKTLTDAVVRAGKHNVVWNGDDTSGHSVGSGVYFYRMHTSEYTTTRKMLLMK